MANDGDRLDGVHLPPVPEYGSDALLVGGLLARLRELDPPTAPDPEDEREPHA